MGELLFYPSALILIFEILVILALANFITKKWLTKEGTVPILVGFLEELFPILAVWWSVVLALFILFKWEFLPLVGIWATVTTIMLWPVGENLSLDYLSYRRPLFILGVLSMAAILALGFALQYLPKGSLSRDWWLLSVVAILTIFSFIAGSKEAIGKPIKMFFRPDILFGDGRVLATGIISLGLSMGILFGPKLPAGLLPVPAGSWPGLYFAVAFGILQIIPLRGMFKLLLRVTRLAKGKLGNWVILTIKEGWLLLGALGIMYGFHNAFMGKVPILDQTLMGLTPTYFESSGKPGLILMGVSGFLFIFVRGAYKTWIGDPFFKETISQSIVKNLLFLASVVPFVYGFAHVMAPGSPFPRFPHTDFRLWVGLSLFFWGLVMLGPIRVWIQQVQKEALIKQMAAVILPNAYEKVRETSLEKVLIALSEMSDKKRLEHMKTMQEAISEAGADVQKTMTDTRVEVLSKLPSDKRRIIMSTMDKVMLGA